jgi:hypothetical protein
MARKTVHDTTKITIKPTVDGKYKVTQKDKNGVIINEKTKTSYNAALQYYDELVY